MSARDTRFRFDGKSNFDFHAPERGRTGLDLSLEEIEQQDLARRLQEEELAYLFKHALVQDAAYATLMKQERKRLHLVVAQELESTYPDRLDENAARLAQHYAEAGDTFKTALYSTRAGDTSMRVFAAEQARTFYRAAFELLKGLPETDEVLRARFEALVKYARLALAAEDTRTLFMRLLEAEELGKRLVVENLPSDRTNLAYLRYEIARVFLTINEPFKAFAYCDLMLEDARVLGDEGLAVLAEALKGVGKMDQGNFAVGIAQILPVLGRLEQSQTWRDWAWFSMNYAFALSEHGEVQQALEIGAKVGERAEETQDGWIRCVYLLYHACIYWAAGNLAQSLAYAQRVMQMAVEGNELVFMQLGSLPQMWIESRLGDSAAAERTLAQRQALIEQVGLEIVWADWGAAARAEMALNAGDAGKALALAETAVQVAKGVEGIFAQGFAERTWGQALARTDASQFETAERHLAFSLELFQRGEANLEAARTHMAWGNILRDRGRDTSAREHFEKAVRQFETSGLTKELDETRVLMETNEAHT